MEGIINEGLKLWHLILSVAGAAVGATLWAQSLHRKNKDAIHELEKRVVVIEEQMRGMERYGKEIANMARDLRAVREEIAHIAGRMGIERKVEDA